MTAYFEHPHLLDQDDDFQMVRKLKTFLKWRYPCLSLYVKTFGILFELVVLKNWLAYDKRVLLNRKTVEIDDEYEYEYTFGTCCKNWIFYEMLPSCLCCWFDVFWSANVTAHSNMVLTKQKWNVRYITRWNKCVYFLSGIWYLFLSLKTQINKINTLHNCN